MSTRTKSQPKTPQAAKGDPKPKAARSRKKADPAASSDMPAGPLANGKVKAVKKAAPSPPKGDRKISALDAAVMVLKEAGRPMKCQEMIDAMAAKNYWKSPGGKTPAATLSAAILREIAKAAGPRFQKADRGTFRAV